MPEIFSFRFDIANIQQINGISKFLTIKISLKTPPKISLDISHKDDFLGLKVVSNLDVPLSSKSNSHFALPNLTLSAQEQSYNRLYCLFAMAKSLLTKNTKVFFEDFSVFFSLFISLFQEFLKQ